MLKKRNFACPQNPTIFKEILEYLNWVIFNHACKYHFKLTIFQKFQSRTAHQRKFQLFFEANSLILCQHLLGFFNHLKPASKCRRNFLYCVSKKKALQKYLHAKIDTKWVCVKKRNMAKIAQNYTNTRNSQYTQQSLFCNKIGIKIKGTCVILIIKTDWKWMSLFKWLEPFKEWDSFSISLYSQTWW